MSLIRSGTILFLASMAGNVSNYLFQFFMSRHLSIEDYGTMNAAFSMLIMVGIPTATIMMVLAKYISKFNAQGEENKISSLYRNSVLKMSGLGLLVFAAFLFFRNNISEYLKLNDSWPVIIIGFGLFWAFIITVNFGMLQGLKRFYLFGTGMGLIGILKLLSGVVLVLLGFGLNGAISTVVVSTFLVFAITSVPLRSYLKEKGRVEKNTGDILIYSIPVLLSTIAFAALTNIDLLIVKHMFSAEEAGLYAAVSILGKTLLYLPSALTQALFPLVSEAHTLNQDTFKLLDKGLLYTFAIALAGVAGFTVFPETAIMLLFGQKYASAAPLLKYYGLAMTFLSIVSIFISFNLARHRTGFVYSLIAACAALVILIHYFHGSLMNVILIIAAVSACLALFNFFLIYRDRKSFYLLRPKVEGLAQR